MKQEVLKAWDSPWLPVTALLIFAICFAIYTWWTYRSENRSYYESIAKIPLDDKDRV